MTITFFSNFLNIHQLPFCEELMKHIGSENFKFVATKQMAQDRVQMSFEDMNVTKPFVVRAYESEYLYEEAKKLALDSDVAIMGSAPMEYTKIRMRTNRLTFQYSERLLKLGWKAILMPGFCRSYVHKFLMNKNKKMYVLCASAYTATDLQLLCFPREKCFKWGYFPEMKPYPNYDFLHEKKSGLKRSGVSILWAGRLIGWKHPEEALFVAKHLKNSAKVFTMEIIGDGPLRTDLEKKVSALGLSDNVHLLGAQSHSVVLDKMEQADIFLFTSDRNEGWGAVLNEAMNAGCAIIASDAIGSAPFLIRDGENGFLYSDGKKAQLADKVCELIEHRERIDSFSKNAFITINEDWGIENATNKFIKLINGIITQGNNPIKDGPCSNA